MKKTIYLLFIVICGILLIGCGPNECQGEECEEPCIGEECEEPCTGDECTVIEKPEYEEIIVTYFDTTIPDIVDSNITLPTSYTYEDDCIVDIVWSSSNARTLSSKGVYRSNALDEQITLSATITSLDFDEEYSYTKAVSTTGLMTKEEYLEIISVYIPDYVYNDITLVKRDLTFASKNWFGNITYNSSDEDVLTSQGVYCNQNANDTKVIFSYTIELNGIVVTGQKEVTVEGKKELYYAELAKEWLSDYFTKLGRVMESIDLPSTDDNDRVRFTWASSNLDVLSNEGVLVTFASNLNTKLTVTITMGDTVETWETTVYTHNEEEAFAFLINKLHYDVINQGVTKVFDHNATNAGYLPFYVQDVVLSDAIISTSSDDSNKTYAVATANANVNGLRITTGLLPVGRPGRPKTAKVSTDFITVHDTGDSVMSAAQWNNYVVNSDTRQVSWNFTVDDVSIYQHVPLSEVAYHAGDGSNAFKLIDTGIKYAGVNPTITLGNDHYLYINGQKSSIATPKVTSTSSTYYGSYANAITPAGLYTCKGGNGNYYIDNVYASTYSQASGILYVCSSGGNRNSVGIESCINKGVDYNQVMRNTANLVAHLLVYYDLDTTRVLQHRNFSGKLCPQVMIQNDTWKYFMNMVEAEYYILKYMPNIKLEYTSNNPSILSNSGKILKMVTEKTTVSYDVKITFNGKTETFTKETVIMPV